MNSAVPFWFQSTDAAPTPPVPPVGVELIGNSIRFLSQAYTVQRNVGTAGSNSTVTISMWSKSVAPNTTGNNGPNNNPCAFSSRRSDGARKFRFTNNNLMISNNNGGVIFANAVISDNARWYDNSAWTHAVLAVDTTQATNAECVRMWMNGVEQPLTFTDTWNGQDISCFTANNTINVFGGWGNNNPGSGFNQVVGYHTEFRIVDGQQLTADAFGVYNEEGIWSPRPADEVNARVGDYGTNGAYLGFEDPNVTTNTANLDQAIFLDTAPIDTDHSAANNFTGAVNGGTFVVSPARIFSDDLTTNTSFSAADPRTDVFNNNTGDGCDAIGQGGVTTRITFAPTVPFTNLSSLEIFNGVVADQQSIFGGVTTQNLATSQWVTIPLGDATELSATSPLVIERQQQSGSVQINAIRVNGVVLVDRLFQQEVDWVADSPSNNYALINTQCTDANVQTVESGNCSFLGNSATFSLNTNVGDVPDKFYFETNNRVTAGVGNAGAISFGFGTEDEQNPDVNLTFNVESLNTRGNNGGQFGYAVDMTAGGGGIATTGCVFVFDRTEGAWLDGDAAFPTDPNINAGGSNAVAQFTYNAELPKTLFVRSLNGATNNCDSFYNFGQFGFFQAPPTTYATGLLATSITNPGVDDGSDGFRALQATGPAILTVAQGNANDQNGSTGFASGMWWIKNVGDTNRWQMLDNFTISGLDTTENCWITPNTTTGAPYVPPANASVAYCHSTTETWTAAGIGEGFRNPTSQFSMLTYTGDGTTNRDVPHGLNSAPGMIWLYNPNGGDVKVFMSGLLGDGTATDNLILNTSEAAGDQFSAGIIQRPNATTFRPGLSSAADANVGGINNLGDIYRAYCWASVPGYSAFGSFRSGGGGPGATNGSFIYTGFAPRVLIIKANGTDNWTVIDSVQNEFNESETRPTTFLIFNEPNAATTIGGQSLIQVRLLSNGFKIVGSNGQIGNTNNLPGAMYAAFAASPFGGGNVQPGTSQLQAPQATPSTGGGLITNSLRFRGVQFLISQTATVPALFTISLWVKFSTTATDNQSLYGNDTSVRGYKLSSPNNATPFSLNSRDNSGNFFFGDALLRDPSAWYHIVIQNNNGTSTAFINGVQQPNSVTTFTRAGTLFIGTGNATGDEFLVGYLADYYCAEQILAPTAFGNYNAEGVWSPRTEAEITTAITDAGGYGDNGFKLIMNQSNIQFSQPPLLFDQSGNDNDFEMHNFELADEASDDFDLMVDGPSTNFSTLNPITQVNPTSPTNNGNAGGTAPYRNANLEGNSAGIQNGGPWQSSAAIPGDVNTTYYFEVFMQAVAGQFPSIGVMQATQLNQSFTITPSLIEYRPNGNIQQMPDNVNDTATVLGTGDTYTTGDIISASLNTSTNSLIFFKNGVQQFEVTTYDFSDQLTVLTARLTGAGDSFTVNYGQQPFQHQPANTVGVQQRNMPAAPVNDGSDCFRVVQSAGAAIRPVATGVLNDGNGSTGFSSGLYWIKETAANNTTQWQFTTTLTADQTYLSPAGTSGTYTAPPGESFSWCWEAGQAFIGTNVVSGLRNTDGGFSMVLYTGDGNATQAIDHGLGEVPAMTTVFDRGANNGYRTFVTGMTVGQTTSLDSDAVAAATTTFSSIDATSVTVEGNQNTAGHDYMLWTWAAVSGYSSMGTYTGNGSADGTFVYTGFTPHGLLLKRNSGGNGSPVVYDSTRNDSNPVDFTMILSEAGAQEGGTDAVAIDFLANGFKLRNTDNALNAQGSTYMYAAWGAQPFGGSNVQPMTAALQSPQPTPTSVQDLNSRSLRFSGAATDLTCPVVTTGARTWTWSAWVKKANPTGGGASLFSPRSGGISSFGLRFRLSNTDNLGYQSGATTLTGPNSGDRLFRDSSAWYHVVCRCDFGTSLMTLYVNGQQVGQGATDNTAMAFDGNMKFSPANATNGGNFYIADVYLVEQSLAATAFGNYNAEGVWVPRTEANITTTITDGGGYGDNGFKLIMNQSNITFGNTTLLQDQSGNNNDFTFVGPFELIDDEDSDYSLMADSSSTNFATLNPLDITAGTLTDGNLETTAAANATAPTPATTIFNVTEGDYYIEFGGNNGNPLFAITAGDALLPLGSPLGGATAGLFFANNNLFGGTGSTTQSLIPNVTQTADFNWAIRIDIDNEQMSFWANGTSQGTFTFAQLETNIGGNLVLQNQPLNFFGVSALGTADYNFGQQPYRFPANAAGTTTLNCRNLPAVPVTSGAAQFRNLEAAGADISAVASGTTTTDTHVSGQPDTGFGQGLWWIKDITAGSTQWQMQDPFLRASGDSVAQSPSRNVAAYAAPANNSLVYAWNTTDTSVTNNDGAVESNVWVNTTAGLSCMQWVGTGANTTVGHGLDGPIDFLVVKAVGPNDPDQDTRNFTVFTTGFTGNAAGGDPRCALFLNAGSAASDTPFWGNPGVFNPNNSGTDVICVGTDPDTNRAATNMVAWAWTSVSGYSSFDRYSGNGDASGPFIYTGFAPAAVCVKSQEVGRNWIWETKVQNQSNPANTFLSTNLEEAEATNNNQAIDFLSNGFKIRSSDNDVNQDGELYIYCAWAQSPFGGNNVSPANAQ